MEPPTEELDERGEERVPIVYEGDGRAVVILPADGDSFSVC